MAIIPAIIVFIVGIAISITLSIVTPAQISLSCEEEGSTCPAWYQFLKPYIATVVITSVILVIPVKFMGCKKLGDFYD